MNPQNPYPPHQQHPQPSQQQQPYGQPPQGYGQPPMAPQAHGSASDRRTASGSGMTPRVQEALGLIDLLANEQIVYAIQADGFFLGSNPIAKVVAAFTAFLVTLTGGYIRIFLVVTNQRLLMIKATQMWCGCARVRAVHTVALAGVKEVGSAKETQLCCINTRTIQVQSMTQLFNLVIKKLGDQEIRQFVTNLSAVIVAHSGRSSV
jgi:hypothetical protein